MAQNITIENPTQAAIESENNLICEKLLRWECSIYRSAFGRTLWKPYPFGSDGEQWVEIQTPLFADWEEAGLILDEFAKRKLSPMIRYWDASQNWSCSLFNVGSCAITGPLAIRRTALQYLKHVEMMDIER